MREDGVRAFRAHDRDEVLPGGAPDRREAPERRQHRFAPARAVLRRFVLPKPGQGPSSHERETGRYEVLFIGETASGHLASEPAGPDEDLESAGRLPVRSG